MLHLPERRTRRRRGRTTGDRGHYPVCDWSGVASVRRRPFQRAVDDRTPQHNRDDLIGSKIKTRDAVLSSRRPSWLLIQEVYSSLSLSSPSLRSAFSSPARLMRFVFKVCRGESVVFVLDLTHTHTHSGIRLSVYDSNRRMRMWGRDPRHVS